MLIITVLQFIVLVPKKKPNIDVRNTKVFT